MVGASTCLAADWPKTMTLSTGTHRIHPFLSCLPNKNKWTNKIYSILFRFSFRLHFFFCFVAYLIPSVASTILFLLLMFIESLDNFTLSAFFDLYRRRSPNAEFLHTHAYCTSPRIGQICDFWLATRSIRVWVCALGVLVSIQISRCCLLKTYYFDCVYQATPVLPAENSIIWVFGEFFMFLMFRMYKICIQANTANCAP